MSYFKVRLASLFDGPSVDFTCTADLFVVESHFALVL